MNRSYVREASKKIAAILIIFSMLFTGIPTITGGLDSHAASAKAPAQVKGLKGYATGQTSIRISWTKIKKNKNTKGYAIYRNGAFIKNVGKGTSAFTNTGLRAGTSYKYHVRAYNTYKQKQWYNKKTKKWSTKKPAKKYRGKSRNVTKYKYGKYSAARTVATKAAPKVSTGTASSSPAGPSVGGITVTDKDTWFTNSTLPATATYIIEQQKSTRYTVDSKGTVTWASSDSTIAKVSPESNGSICTVNFLKAGTVKITAKSELNGKIKTITLTLKSNSVNENVTGKFEIAGEKPVKIDLSKNRKVDVSFPVSGCTVKWTSSNTSFATVTQNTNGSSVNVKATDTAGSATITGTLTVPSGANYSGSKTVSFSVENTIYPQESDGTYLVSYKTSYPEGPTIGGYRGAGSDLISTKFKNGSKFVFTSGFTDNAPVCDFGTNHPASSKSGNDSILWNRTYLSQYGQGIYWVVGQGSTTLTIDGKTFYITVEKTNENLKSYHDFVKTWPSRMNGKTSLNKVKETCYWIKTNFTYRNGYCDPLIMNGTGEGDCIGGNDMLRELLAEMGFECTRTAAEGSSGASGHYVCKVKIDGVYYMVDATPQHMYDDGPEYINPNPNMDYRTWIMKWDKYVEVMNK